MESIAHRFLSSSLCRLFNIVRKYDLEILQRVISMNGIYVNLFAYEESQLISFQDVFFLSGVTIKMTSAFTEVPLN